MPKNTVKVFANITKVDEEQRMVYGYASTEALDSQGEVIKREAIERALPDYMKFGNIREMHQPSAVGKTKEATMDDKGLYIAVKVVDDSAWAKVKEGVYSAFSIGGRKLLQKGREILDLMLTEISLVDRPANPEAVFDMFKAESNGEMSSEDLRMKLYEALAEWAHPGMDAMDVACGYYIVEVYSDHFIAINMEEQQPWKFPFTVNAEGEAALGEPTPVKLVWEDTQLPKEASDIIFSLAKLIHASMGKNQAIKKEEEQKPDEVKAPETPETPVVEEVKDEPVVEKPDEKKDEVVDEPKAEEKVEEKPDEPAKEGPVAEKPETPEKPDEPVVEKPVDAPVEEMAKVGAKLSKESRSAITAAITALTALLGNEEKADTTQNLSKQDDASAASFAKATEVAGLAKQIGELTERLAKFEKAEQPVKAVASFTHTKEGQTEKGNEPALGNLAELEKRAEELKKLRETLPLDKFTLQYGDEANKLYDELQKFRK